MDLKEMMKHAEEIKSKMESAQKELGSLRVEGESGGGMVRVKMNGKNEILEISISDEALKEDKEVLESLVASAINITIVKVKEEAMAKQKNLLGLPAGINFPF